MDDLDGYPVRWNCFQILLSSSCFMPMIMFSKFPLDQYLGSGWTLLSYFVFAACFAGPFCYLQYRLGSSHQKDFITIFTRNFPFSVFAGISALMTNLIKLVLGAAFMTYCLAYVIFTFYHCDGKHCVGSPYIWGSCQDSWSEGDCREGYKKVHLSPLAEEKFLLNYVMARTESASSPYGFPVWFSVPSLIIAPYFAVWLLLLVITFTGYKTFGMALYVLSPAAFSLLLSVVVTVGIKYANAENQLNDFASRFYTRFATHIPVDQSAWDKFQIQPLVWGCLATFVHLSQSFNLWTGVFPLIGKWGGGQRIRRHVSWIPILVGWTVMGQLPTLLMMFSAASSYDPVNLRCHLAADWQAPFVVVPHMFSKFSSRRALSAAFFLGFFCFLLLAQGLLLLTTVVNVMECICPYFDLQFSVSPKKYRLCLFLVVPCLLIIGLPLISRSGFYWIRLVDWYADRLLIFTMALQAAGFLMSYIRTPGTRFETKSFKLVVSGIYGFLFVVASGIYLWYAIPTAQTTPDAECKTFIRAPVDDPITNNYRFLGWLLAFAPVILGLILGIPFLLRLTWPDRIGFFQLLFSGTNSLEERKKRKTKEDIALERIHGPDDPGTYLLHDPRDRWN